jgi:hypothetical protein
MLSGGQPLRLRTTEEVDREEDQNDHSENLEDGYEVDGRCENLSCQHYLTPLVLLVDFDGELCNGFDEVTHQFHLSFVSFLLSLGTSFGFLFVETKPIHHLLHS